MYQAVTRGIRVKVTPRFLPDESEPGSGRFFWAYSVRIDNGSPETVQLLSRHWQIVDGNGHFEEVRGDGVVGEQPVIEPGGHFDYTSGCPLTTPDGTMSGSYRMRVNATGETFEAEIPAFALTSPYARRTAH